MLLVCISCVLPSFAEEPAALIDLGQMIMPKTPTNKSQTVKVVNGVIDFSEISAINRIG